MPRDTDPEFVDPFDNGEESWLDTAKFIVVKLGIFLASFTAGWVLMWGLP